MWAQSRAAEKAAWRAERSADGWVEPWDFYWVEQWVVCSAGEWENWRVDWRAA